MIATKSPTLHDITPRVLRILSRCDSDCEGERQAAIEAATRVLHASGLTFRELVQHLEHGSPEPEPFEPEYGDDMSAMVREALRPEHRDRLYPKEPPFLEQMASLLRRGGTPTEAQTRWIEKIAYRIGGTM